MLQHFSLLSLPVICLSPGCPWLRAVVPGGPHQRHAPEAALPLHHLMLRHAVAKVAAGGAALHDGDPWLQVEADHSRGQDQQRGQGGHH